MVRKPNVVVVGDLLRSAVINRYLATSATTLKRRKLSKYEVAMMTRLIFSEIKKNLEKGKVVVIEGFGRFTMVESKMKYMPMKEKGGKKGWFFVGKRVDFWTSTTWFRRMNNEDVKRETRLRYADKIQGGY